ncbi:MAG: transposase [Bacillota bacterium]|nr:transposase [Bacillota bacterium]
MKQRQKLNPLVFLSLARHHAKSFYQDPEMVKKKNNYLVLAADGSAINIPANRMIIDCSINRWKFGEREQARLHMDNMMDVIGAHPCVIIFDRSYPSGEFFLDLIERHQKFLFRLLSTTFKKELNQMTSDDCLMEVVFDAPRLNPHQGTATGDKLAKAGSIVLRFVRVKLKNGDYEYLTTNLSFDEFTTNEIADLYAMRWSVETAFDDLKNKLGIENFTRSKPILLEQDIYATIYLCNIINDLVIEAQMELE